MEERLSRQTKVAEKLDAQRVRTKAARTLSKDVSPLIVSGSHRRSSHGSHSRRSRRRAIHESNAPPGMDDDGDAEDANASAAPFAPPSRPGTMDGEEKVPRHSSHRRRSRHHRSRFVHQPKTRNSKAKTKQQNKLNKTNEPLFFL